MIGDGSEGGGDIPGDETPLVLNAFLTSTDASFLSLLMAFDMSDWNGVKTFFGHMTLIMLRLSATINRLACDLSFTLSRIARAVFRQGEFVTIFKIA